VGCLIHGNRRSSCWLNSGRARTEAGQDKALKDKFLASNAAALAKEAQAKKKLLEAEAQKEKALLEAKMMVELVARFSKEE
jgi:nickel-dependent lactate racemase